MDKYRSKVSLEAIVIAQVTDIGNWAPFLIKKHT